MDQKTIEEGKTLGLVAYLTLFGTLIAFFMNKDKRNPFTSFHVRQALEFFHFFNNNFLIFVFSHFFTFIRSFNLNFLFWIHNYFRTQ